MYRIPSINEIIGLFYQPTKVVHAIKGIETAAQRADSVVQFNQAQSEQVSAARDELAARADQLGVRATEHAEEAQRAARVSTRLRELVA